MTNNSLILIVEDDNHIRKYLRSTIETYGMQPLEALNAKEAVHMIIAKRPDVILLDLGLPDKDGQSLIQELREWTQTPIIVLSAREEEAEKIMALGNGADDYLTKPFKAGELIARIKVSLRHAEKLGNGGNSIFKYDDFTMDFAAKRVFLGETEIHLTPIEYRLLNILVKNSGKIIARTQLLKEVWGKNIDDHGNHLRIHTQHLREKLGDNPMLPKYVITIPGIGYRFGD